MASMSGNCLGSLLLCVRLSLLFAVLLVPALVQAESISLVRTAMAGSPDPVASRRVDNRPLLVGLDKNGDVTVYYRNVSLTMSYNPVDMLPPARDRVVLNSSPDASVVGGFGVKVGIAF